MASAFSHALVALALGRATPHRVMTRSVVWLGMVCSIIPDADVIGFSFGIQYGDLWGHRGLTHSLFFAGLLSMGLVALWYRHEPARIRIGLWVYFFLCTASHGVLDAMTDGGLGVAFFSPVDPSRYFFTVRPVAVSPIGIGEFFTADAIRVLASETTWIWFPTLTVFLIVRAFQRWRYGRPAVEPSRAD